MTGRGRARGRSRPREDDEATFVGPPPLPGILPPPASFSDDSSVSSRFTVDDVVELSRRAAAMRVAEPAATDVISTFDTSDSAIGSSDGSAASAAAAAAPAETNRAASREAAPEGGAVPKRRDPAAVAPPRSSARGQNAGGGKAGRAAPRIDDVIFGGYSRENKKEFQDYITTDTRQKNVSYAKGGEQWEKADVVANSFRLASTIGDYELNQYHVSYDPVVDSTHKRKSLLFGSINNFTTEPSHDQAVFDGAVLFLPSSNQLRGGRKEITLKVPDSEVCLTIKHTACLTTSSPTVKQVLNRTFRDAQAATGLVQIGRHYFNHEEPTEINKYNINIWPGFSTRIDQYDCGIMATIDTISKVMKSRTVLELMTEWALETDDTVRSRSKTEKEIVGETVLTRYNNKNYRIDGIDWSTSPLAEFTKNDGSVLTYQAYYKLNYNLDVVSNQPLLIHRPKPKEQRMRDLQGLEGNIFLIPQLCHLTGLGTMRQDMTIMREVAKVTRFDPNERHDHTTRFMRRLQGSEKSKSELRKLNLQFEPSLREVADAKVMPKTDICQGGSSLRYGRDQADWSRALADRRFNDGVALNTWQVVLPRKSEPAVRKFVQELSRIGNSVGMTVRQPEFHVLEQTAGRDFISQIRGIGDTQMIMCVLPDDKKDRYDAIKQLLCCQRPVPSQLVLSKTCGREKILRSIATKVLLQMNCKLGGSPWDARIPFKRDGVVMIVGIDTFVDAKMASKSTTKVFGGMVASFDAQASKWFSRPLLRSDDTIERGLKRSFEEALRNYKQHNGQLPERVLVYRDGVGDGQLAHVQREEVNAYMEACRKCDPKYEPKLTVTVVTKRVPQRFFLKRGPNYVNPQPGTVVDTTVTKHNSEMIDFYVISQSTNQGTVSPTHYNIIYDFSGWSLDRHQLLAYKLCHLYYNWAGAIRVPAPCQYAHKLAFMVNQNLHKAPSDRLDFSDRLWYL